MTILEKVALYIAGLVWGIVLIELIMLYKL